MTLFAVSHLVGVGVAGETEEGGVDLLDLTAPSSG